MHNKIDRVLKKLLEDDLIYSYQISSIDTHMFELIINDDAVTLTYTYMGLSHLTYDELLKIISFDVRNEIENSIINDINDILDSTN